jgi:vacuolar protein sorting-associated protein 52
LLSRHIQCLDPFFLNLSMIIWPQFKRSIDDHCASLTKTPIFLPPSLHVHIITQRYARLLCTFVALAEGDSILVTSSMQLRKDVQKYLEKCSATLQKSQDRAVFLLNNYAEILALLLTVGGGKASAEYVYFEEQQNAQLAVFVEEQLGRMFGSMIDFVRRCEPILGRDDMSPEAMAKAITDHSVEQLVMDFNRSWKGVIAKANDAIVSLFAESTLGTVALKQVFTQLLLYYSRFLEVIRKRWQHPPFERDIVSVPSIMYEIKRYSR